MNVMVKSNNEINKNIFSIHIESSQITKDAKPGQFVEIKCGDAYDAYLRRPFSICRIKDNSMEIVYQVKGRGTEILSKYKAGDFVDILGPLGNGFLVDDSKKKIALVGGGIGVFPLLFLLEEYKNANVDTFLGFRSKDFVVFEDAFKQLSEGFYLTTDDGTYGEKGYVTEKLEKELTKKKYDMIYTCGPEIMLQTVVKMANDGDIPCQVSMEQRMACGVGACIGCVCKVGTKENWKNLRVCKDGPVFEGKDLFNV